MIEILGSRIEILIPETRNRVLVLQVVCTSIMVRNVGYNYSSSHHPPSIEMSNVNAPVLIKIIVCQLSDSKVLDTTIKSSIHPLKMQNPSCCKVLIFRHNDILALLSFQENSVSWKP